MLHLSCYALMCHVNPVTQFWCVTQSSVTICPDLLSTSLFWSGSVNAVIKCPWLSDWTFEFVSLADFAYIHLTLTCTILSTVVTSLLFPSEKLFSPLSILIAWLLSYHWHLHPIMLLPPLHPCLFYSCSLVLFWVAKTMNMNKMIYLHYSDTW
jgi:hypothetical protein